MAIKLNELREGDRVIVITDGNYCIAENEEREVQFYKNPGTGETEIYIICDEGEHYIQEEDAENYNLVPRPEDD